MGDKVEYGLHNNTSGAQLSARETLMQLFQNRPMSDDLLLTNFGLYFRSSALAKMFFLKEAYEKIRGLPGDIYVFGVWLGQDVVGFESMRAMIEPYNASRKIVGFDTFDGYSSITDKDVTSATIKTDGYKTPPTYRAYLEELLAYHRRENVMGHAVTHTLVEGDISVTAPKYVADNPASMVALAYFDLALYQPTLAGLNAIADRLMPGSVLVMDELNDPRYPGETQAFREWIADRPYAIARSEILPDRTYVTLK